MEYRISREFNLTKEKLEELVMMASDLDRIATASMEDLYGLGEEEME